MYTFKAMPDIIATIFAAVSLIIASVQDIRTKSVTNAVWWIFSAGLLMMFFCEKDTGPAAIAECITVIVIQELIMSRAYGRADSHAFSCCAVYLILTGAGLEGHILHMSLALAMLVVVQILRRNIACGLKLKEPVPFIPYIAVTFIISAIILHIVIPLIC